MKTYTYKLAVYFICTLLFSCTKFRDRLDTANNDSGIISIVRGGRNISEAQIDEQITIYAKIGQKSSDVKMFVSDKEASIVSRGTTNADGYEKDTFNILIPRTAKIGPGSVYFSINGQIMPSLAFTVKRPDILFAGKIWVQPLLRTYSDSVWKDFGWGFDWSYTYPEVLRDGLSGDAVINCVLKLAYDKDANTFYFIDYQTTDRTLIIRRLKDGNVTTIAGGGDNYFASDAASLKIGSEDFIFNGFAPLDMRPGPDGKLYFTNRFTLGPDPVTGVMELHTLIERIDPVTGTVEIVAGNNKRNIEYYFSNTNLNYRGFEDGSKDSAMIDNPTALNFDKQGNLYFLDAGYLLRRLNKDGSIQTVVGKMIRDVYEFEDSDGKTYYPVFYTGIDEHTDGFGDEVRLCGVTNMALAGNGKLYILGTGGGWQQNIVEVNIDTKEASTVVGLPDGVRSDYITGTFKEVGLSSIRTFDVDFDGNILFGISDIFKMDLQSETITRMTKFTAFPPGLESDRKLMQQRQPGDNCIIGRMNRITFDQFGNLYAGYDQIGTSSEVKIAKVEIEKQ